MGEWGPTATAALHPCGEPHSLADGGMGANRNVGHGSNRSADSLADGGMGANRNVNIEGLNRAISLADGGMGANRNGGIRVIETL